MNINKIQDCLLSRGEMTKILKLPSSVVYFSISQPFEFRVPVEVRFLSSSPGHNNKLPLSPRKLLLVAYN